MQVFIFVAQKHDKHGLHNVTVTVLVQFPTVGNRSNVIQVIQQSSFVSSCTNQNYQTASRKLPLAFTVGGAVGAVCAGPATHQL